VRTTGTPCTPEPHGPSRIHLVAADKSPDEGGECHGCAPASAQETTRPVGTGGVGLIRGQPTGQSGGGGYFVRLAHFWNDCGAHVYPREVEAQNRTQPGKQGAMGNDSRCAGLICDWNY